MENDLLRQLLGGSSSGICRMRFWSFFVVDLDWMSNWEGSSELIFLDFLGKV
jgi:hypothetical protein